MLLRDRPVEGSSLPRGRHLDVERGFVPLPRDVRQLEDAPERLSTVDYGVLDAGKDNGGKLVVVTITSKLTGPGTLGSVI